MGFAQHVEVEELKVVRTDKMMVNVVLDVGAHPVLSLEPVYAFYLSLLHEHSIELLHTFLIVYI